MLQVGIPTQAKPAMAAKPTNKDGAGLAFAGAGIAVLLLVIGAWNFFGANRLRANRGRSLLIQTMVKDDLCSLPLRKIRVALSSKS